MAHGGGGTNLALQGTSEFLGLHGLHLPLAQLGNGNPPRLTLLPRLPRHATCARAGSDRESLTCKPRLEDTAHDIEGARLNHARTDGFGSSHAYIDDALEGKAESVRSGTVKGPFRIERSVHGDM